MAGNLYVSIDFDRTNGNSTDNGSERPWLRDDRPFWGNGSIWLEPGGSQANTGEVSTIKVRVSNNGDATRTGVKVQAFVFVPHVGVTPTPANSKVNVESTPVRIAKGTGLAADGDSHVVTVGTWVPSVPDYDESNQGHMCLAVNVYQSPFDMDDNDTLPAEGAKIGSDGQFHTNEDQRQGQLNVTVVKVSHAQAGNSKTVVYTTIPPDPTALLPRKYLVSVDPVRPRPRLGPLELLALAPHAEVELPREGIREGHPRLRTSKGLETIRMSDAPMEFGLKAAGIPGIGKVFEMNGEDQRSGVPSELTVRLDPDSPVGSLHSFDITLREGKDVIGSGMRVMFLVTE
ncbi:MULTISPECIES: hypothetical protein [unclassified Streptomyces]|uniref:hypothetical protein n=1 Tax=unclassified Streptomyces TaxID=2593676 RepID=UPI001660BFD2|nr:MULTISPECIES: hypothetical protein [unclassified Streptomyces]MBD0708183.1 hypothetical protein [Streptomyces sp. CBMA291]MBD0714507.1 hypothetical protein [Streptomyces sp. CBMA370]